MSKGFRTLISIAFIVTHFMASLLTALPVAEATLPVTSLTAVLPAWATTAAAPLKETLPSWFAASAAQPGGEPQVCPLNLSFADDDASGAVSHHTIRSANVTVSGPNEINNCDVVTYTIVAANDAVTTTNVIITSAMPSGFAPLSSETCVSSTVLPNETLTCTVVYQAGCDAVSGQNVVTVSQDGYGNFNLYTNFIVNPGAITLRKEPSVIPARIGDVVTWTVYVENTGYGTVSNVAVTDTLGTGLQYVGGITSTQYISIPKEETQTFTVAARVVSCSGLDNNVDASWGCPGQTCQTHTAQASVDLEVLEPELDYSPPNINIDYCTGQATYAMTVTNIGQGTAFTPSMAVDFSPFTVTASSAPYSGGAFHLPDIPSGNFYPLTFTLSLPDSPCGSAGSNGSLLYEPTYYDECGNPFSFPVENGLWAVGGNMPSLDVSKSGPNEVYADEIITYTLNVNSANISGTVYITDTFQPGCTTFSPLNMAGGTVITDTSGNITITWATTATNWSAEISFQPDATFCPTMCACCGLLAINNLEASGSDCQNCTVEGAAGVDTAIQCEGILNSHDKEIAPVSDESCTTRAYTSTYVFGSSFTVTPTWQGMIYTDTLLHQGYITGSAWISISNGAQTCTATFSLSDTTPLVIGNILPTCPVTVPGATMRVFFQAVVDDAGSPCGSASFYDWSYLNIGVTGNGACPGDPQCDDGVFEEGVWVEVEEPEMEVTISGVPAQVAACGVYTPLVTLARVGSTPAYDARLTFPTADYAIVEVLGFDGATPVVTHTGATSYTWEYADAFTTATTATVRLRVQRRCAATGPVQATAGYDNHCTDDGNYDNTCTASDSDSPRVLTAHPILYKFPEIIYATGDVVTWTLTAINSGAGPAYGVTLTDTLGSDLRYLTSTITSTAGSAAGVAPITSTNLVTWSNLTFLSGEEYIIRYTAEIIGCDDLTNEFAGLLGCQGEACDSAGPIVSEVRLPETVLINTNNALTPLRECLTRTITATVRNAGLLSVYSATLTETLPVGMIYVTGSTEYVTGTGASAPASGWLNGGEPLSVTNPSGTVLNWDSDQIANLAHLLPHQTIWVRFNVRASCNFEGGNITIQAAYQDVCGDVRSSTASNFAMPSVPAEMTAQKQGLNLTIGSAWSDIVYAEPGDIVLWAITLTNSSDTDGFNVVVTDVLPANTTYIAASPTPDGLNIASGVITWNLNTLGQTSWSALITSTVNMSECTEVDTTNAFTTTWGCPDGCREQVVAQAALRTRPVFDEPSIATDLPPATIHRCGGPITITLVNNGPPAYDVVLTDTLPTGFVYSETIASSATPSGTIDLGQTVVYTWNVLPTGLTTITFLVNSGDGGACNEPVGGNTIITTLYDDSNSCLDTGPYTSTATVNMNVVSPTLEIEKTPTVQSANAGEVVTWTITVRNTGSGDAPNVVVTDTIGSGFIETGVITWAAGTIIANGGVWTTTLTATVSAGGAQINALEAAGTCAAGCTYAAANNTAHVTLVEDFDKGPEIQTGTIGSLIVFSFTTSLPDVDALYQDFILTDTLPAGLGYVSSILTYTYDSGASGQIISNTPTITPGWLDSGSAVWQLGDLSGTVSINGVITAVIQNTTANQSGLHLINVLTMIYTDDGQPYVYTDTAQVDVLEPLLHIAKSYITPDGCEATLLEDNFNFDTGLNPAVIGNWNRINNNIQAAQGALHLWSGGDVGNSTALSDFSLSFMARKNDEDVTGSNPRLFIHFRRQASGDRYNLEWQADGDLRLYRTGGAGTFGGTNNTINLVPHRWYHFEIRAEQNRIQVYVDGRQIFDDTDDNFGNGTIQIRTNAASDFDIDDILVTRFGQTGCLVGANNHVTYTLTISNQARIPGYDLVITDSIPAGMSLLTYTMQSDDPASAITAEPAPIPGATGDLLWNVNQLTATFPFSPLNHTALTLTVVLTVSDGITANVTLPNQASLTYDNWEDDGDPVGDQYGIDIERTSSGGSHSTAVRTVDGAIAKTVQFSPPPTATLGSLVTYTLIVPAQPISATLYDVNVYDSLDSRLQLLTVADGPDGTIQTAGNTITVTYPSIVAGEQRLITITARISDGLGADAGETITNSAVMTHPTATEITHTNTVSTVVGEPDLDILKASDPPTSNTVGAGDPVTYTVTITNAGDPAGSSPAYDIVFTDTLPAGMRATAPSLIAVTLDGAAVAAGLYVTGYDGSTGVFTVVFTSTFAFSVPVGSVLEIEYVAQVDADVSAGLHLTNDAEVIWSGLPGATPGDRDYGPEGDDTTVHTPLPSLDKTVVPITATLGNLITYTIRVPQPVITATLYNVAVTDQLDPRLQLLTVADGPDGTIQTAGNTITVTYPSIVAGEQRLITITALISDPLGAHAGDVITNVAILTHSNGATTSNEISTTIIEPDLTLSKDADPPGGSIVDGDDWITYTVVITNDTGPHVGPAYDLVIWDDLPNWMTTTTPVIIGLAINGSAVTTDSQSYDSASGRLTITLTPGISLPVGGRLVFSYSAQVDAGVPSGLALTNHAQGSYSSLPGDIPGDRDYTTNEDDETHYTPIATGLLKFVTPPTAAIGSQIVYTYQIPSPVVAATLLNVVFTDSIPSNLAVTGVSGDGGFLSAWSGGNLVTGTVNSIPPDSFVVVTVTCTVRDIPTNTDGTIITNTATMDYSANPNTPPESNVVTVTVRWPNVTVSKVVVPAVVASGGYVTFTLAYSNTGPVPAENVVITDTLPSGLSYFSAAPSPGGGGGRVITWSLGALGAGAGGVIHLVATVDATSTTYAELTNTVIITTTTPETDSTDNDDDATTILTQTCDLSIAKTARPPSVASNDALTYTLTYANAGPADADDVILTDTLPTGLTFSGCDPATCGAAGRIITWSLGTVPAGASGVLTIYATVDVTGATSAVFSNTVHITTSTPDRDPDNNDDDETTPLTQSIGLDVIKVAEPSTVAHGQTLTYTVRLRNIGDVPLNPVALTDTLPAGLLYAGSATPVEPDTITGSTLIWNDVTSGAGLPAGAAQTITFRTIVSVGAGVTGTYLNFVSGRGEYPGGVVTDTDSTPITVTVPGVAVEKSLAEHNREAGIITFSIAVINTGPSVLDVIPIYDEYDPYYLAFRSADPAPDEPEDDGRLDWYDLTAPNGFNANLPPGERFTITVAFGIMHDITTTTNTVVVTGAADVHDNPADDDEDDEVINDVPTFVELLYFRAAPQTDAVLLEWATAVEIDNYGFYLLRGLSGSLVAAQEIAFVPAAGHGRGSGAEYSYKDFNARPGIVYSYWLVDVDTNGKRTVHSPVMVAALPNQPWRIYLPLILKP